MNHPPRVVFDTVVFIQTLISGRGPAAACINRAKTGQAIMLVTDALYAEIRDVSARPRLTGRFPHLTHDRVDAFVQEIQSQAVDLSPVFCGIALPRDPKDQFLLDLAVTGGADFLVTWNERHLTYLMQRDTPEGIAFCTRFPGIQIISPTQLLTILDAVGPSLGSP